LATRLRGWRFGARDASAFARVADSSATVVRKLPDAGAALFGKTNLDISHHGGWHTYPESRS
jgi:Asp-tRNA(Asn)/Glu-tRNA(Gln) amidotransferase A subunit family amidase